METIELLVTKPPNLGLNSHQIMSVLYGLRLIVTAYPEFILSSQRVVLLVEKLAYLQPDARYIAKTIYALGCIAAQDSLFKSILK